MCLPFVFPTHKYPLYDAPNEKTKWPSAYFQHQRRVFFFLFMTCPSLARLLWLIVRQRRLREAENGEFLLFSSS
jgi:hypothetical protein